MANRQMLKQSLVFKQFDSVNKKSEILPSDSDMQMPRYTNVPSAQVLIVINHIQVINKITQNVITLVVLKLTY